MIGQTELLRGASGFIGTHLCRRLEQEGFEVHAVSRRPHPPLVRSVRWWQADAEDSSAVQRLLSAVRPDSVFHLSSYVTGARELEVVAPTLRSNLLSTVNLLIAATEAGCRRVVLAGSLEEPDENGETVPCSPYAASKWASTSYGRMFHQLYGTPVVVARVFMVYGPGLQDHRRLIPYVISSLLRNEAPLLSSGQRLVDWIYVDDVVDALLAAAQSHTVEGCVVDVGSGDLVSIRAIVEQIATILGSSIEPGFGS